MAEEIFQQQLLLYRPIPPPHQLPDCPEERGPAAAAEAPAAPAAAANGPPAAAARKPAGGRPAPGRGGGAAAPKSNAAAEARQKQLAGEAEVRAKVVAVRDGLRRGLAALAAVAAGNPGFTAEQVRAGLGCPSGCTVWRCGSAALHPFRAPVTVRCLRLLPYMPSVGGTKVACLRISVPNRLPSPSVCSWTFSAPWPSPCSPRPWSEPPPPLMPAAPWPAACQWPNSAVRRCPSPAHCAWSC